ncbi:ribosome recycling factor [Candidatus Woesebacteria bacterium RIFCSPLOWO2_01_FULL_39_10]|uniref:Ribosome recycling factor n=1 Tax=Candidatus Woesebacteria bacterium RIFCSPLOWO2_01_FULL_39_10 TaxID=1802516 RepID=A0A1F8BAF8_9BACT|nr:MAG: ribosome recycling factor [Candidatus Woesebacteria bacterium RIFCSPLOWO2_01_FULL_39_10]
MEEDEVKKRMQQVIDLVTSDTASIRTGRATPALIESLRVAVYGGQQKLKILELATITVPDIQTLVIDPWDKSIIGEIRQGMLAANVGLNPSIDGEILRITLPPLTSEDREKFVKLLNTKLENGKVMIRQIRGDGMHDIKESFEVKKISEDEKFLAEKKLQEITDEFVGAIETLGKKKEQELLEL